MNTCQTANASGCDLQRLLPFQLEVGLLSRLLRVGRKNTAGNIVSNHSILCMASPGAGKTLAQWCVAINFCVFEHVRDKLFCIMMVADDEQVKNLAKEVPKLIPLLRNLNSNNEYLHADARDTFLRRLPNKKTILTAGTTPRRGMSALGDKNPGGLVMPSFVGDTGKVVISDGEKLEFPGGDQSVMDRNYDKVNDRVQKFYDQLLVWLENEGWKTFLRDRAVDDANANVIGKKLLDVRHALKRARGNGAGKWSTRAMNVNAFVQTVIELTRCGQEKSVLGDVYRLQGDARDAIEKGDLVRFYLRAQRNAAPPSPFFYVKYIRYKKGSKVPQEMTLVPLCNSANDAVANIPAFMGWPHFVRIFDIDKDNILRFESVPSVAESIVDIPSAREGEGKMYDLSTLNLNDLLSAKFGTSKQTPMWWMRYGSQTPTWWANGAVRGPWPDPHSKEYPYRRERGVEQAVPQVLILGMTHREFNNMVEKVDRKLARAAWSSTLIICDEVHQFGSGANDDMRRAGVTLTKAISMGAKCASFTATPYKTPPDMLPLCQMLSGETRTRPPAKLSSGVATAFAAQHGVLLYQFDMTSGKNDVLMPSLYPNVSNKRSAANAGVINVQRAVLQHITRNNNLGNFAQGDTKLFDGVVDASILPRGKTSKYPFTKVGGSAAASGARSKPRPGQDVDVAKRRVLDNRIYGGRYYRAHNDENNYNYERKYGHYLENGNDNDNRRANHNATENGGNDRASNYSNAPDFIQKINKFLLTNKEKKELFKEAKKIAQNDAQQNDNRKYDALVRRARRMDAAHRENREKQNANEQLERLLAIQQRMRNKAAKPKNKATTIA